MRERHSRTAASSIASRLLGCITLGGAAWFLGRTVVRRMRRFDFQGTTVLITGGSRGLGLILARKLIEQNARVAICARDRSELDRARSELVSLGGQVLTLACDVADRASVEHTVECVRDQWGGIDVLINNAGVIQAGPQEEMKREDYEHALAVHFWGPLHTTLAVVPEMRRRGRGRIVNIASIGGLISVPHLLPYSASKFALVGLSEGFRSDLLKHNIYVTTVCPGTMRTGSHVNALFKGQHHREAAWFSLIASAPLMSMSAERAANQILHACRVGRAHLVMPLPAKIASLFHGVAPGFTSDFLSLIDWWLPEPGGIGQQQAKGHESRPEWMPGWLTYLGDQAARRNNELPAAQSESMKNAIRPAV